MSDVTLVSPPMNTFPAQLPGQIAAYSSGMQSSASLLCPPAGSWFHPLHGNMHTDYHHQTEKNIYL